MTGASRSAVGMIAGGFKRHEGWRRIQNHPDNREVQPYRCRGCGHLICTERCVECDARSYVGPAAEYDVSPQAVTELPEGFAERLEEMREIKRREVPPPFTAVAEYRPKVIHLPLSLNFQTPEYADAD